MKQMTKVIELVIIFFEEDGYEVTYPNGYKSWSPAKIWEGLGFVLQWAKYGLKK